MQCVLLNLRLLSRAVINGAYANATSSNPSAQQQSLTTSSQSSHNSPTPLTAVSSAAPNTLRLLTAVSGFSKRQGADRVRQGKFGDDAYFVARHQLGDVIGVADGVGGWREWGIDPGEFSQCLMTACEKLVRRGNFSPTDPAQLLENAYQELEKGRSHILGSSTACVVMVRDNNIVDPTISTPSSRSVNPPTVVPVEGTAGVLSSANIGDSGYLVVRAGEVVHRSHEQQHYFNTPFQLSLPPPGTSAHVLSDSPASADSREFEVKVGDMLIVATDGVFDNLPLSSILQILQPVEGSNDLQQLQQTANLIAQTARQHAFDESYMSPFALSAKENGINAQGGKPDDITVVVASILA